MADNSLKKGRYTKYSNKIGLFSNSKGSFIKNDTEVVLNFPFKDTVLEAGMSKEDKGREERFLQIDIDSKDIDTLEEPKVLTDFRYFDKEGERSLTASSDISFFDEDGELKQNLLIKGNNLLALYTLKSRLAGRVKMIYIDPPYNTGGDGFRYNDNFNHSAWLTFMKNRLEVARELLSDEGVIFVQCDDNEQAYLKVLMDEIFGQDCFVSTSAVVINRGGRDYGGIARTHEYLTVFSRQPDIELNLVEDGEKKFRYTDEVGGFDLMELRNRNVLFNDKNRPNLCYPFYVNPDEKDDNGLLEISLEPKPGFVEVMPAISQGIQTVWRWGKEKALANLNVDIKGKAKQNGGYMIVQKYRGTGKRQRSVWDDKEFVNERGTEHIKQLFGRGGFAYPKSEWLIRRVLEIGSNEGDLILDFCLGSGTTSAVAHKMGRRWVGIEQMDYIEDVAKERLKKVVDGEQGGISKSAGWNGGGSFVYFELKKYNQEYIDRIMEATSLKELEDIYVEMRNNAFLKFWFDRSQFEKDEDFRQLDLDGRKEVLADVLDENQLYLNYADMGDTRHKVTADEKVLTDKFYGTNEN
mgnify:CR=1 FL=1